ncbi:hypothetical protein N9N67_05955 [Bacteriovoracaceae bacterium]|nr:hypothetical protein [Bacteriovoracaceae bacterium]
MKAKLLGLAMLIAMSLGSVSCVSSGTGYYEPQWWYNCYPVYDYWGYYLYDDCYWEYYNTDGAKIAGHESRDVLSDEYTKETRLLTNLSNFYATEFNLSTTSATKLAKAFNDYKKLENRSIEDLADFAETLYGTNPVALTKAVAKAQGKDGDYSALEAELSKAAESFGTDPANMKEIVKHFYGKALEESNINL